MKRSLYSHSILATCLTGSLALAGCSGFSAIPDTIVPTQSQMGEIHGSVFGGHAPLVGARVYVLTPGTTGYGSKSTDLLSSSSTATANSYPVQMDTTGSVATNPTYGMYYVTTDMSGSFGISGDYTCTGGAPVYLYAYGGDQTAPTGTTFAVTSAVAGTASGSPSVIPITMTTSAGSGFVSQYNYVTVQGLTGTLAQFNGTSQMVTSVGGSTFTFKVVDPTGGNNIPNGTTFSGLSGTVSVLPGFNPATVNLLVLGDCPKTPAAQNFSYLKFVYVNEVATTAAAYSLSGFTATAAGLTGTTDVNGTTINSAVYIGSPSASTQETTAIANAALNAAQLYDIQGGNLTTAPYGEGHIARSSTPGIVAGAPTNGVVPQALLDTLGNILAACVDSSNTWNPLVSSGAKSSQCWTNIFPTATSNPNGSGTAPTDIAMSMINISRFPGGPSSSTSASNNWVTKLFQTPGASVPFTPNLGTAQPNDFTVALNFYDNSGANLFLDAPSGIAIDSNGNAQVSSGGAGDTGALTDLGTLGYIVGSAYEGGILGSGVAIGPSTTQYIWTANTQKKTTSGTDTLGAFYISADPVHSGNPSSQGAYTDTSVTGGYYAALPSGTAQTQGIAIDGNGTAYIADTAAGIVHKLATPSTLPPPSSNTSPATSVTSTNLSFTGCTTNATGLSTSNNTTGRNVFVTNSSGNTFCEINSSGLLVGSVTGLSSPTGIAADNFGNAWVTDKGSNEVEALTYVSGALRFEVFTTGAGGLNAPYGIAFDGANNMWVANSGNNTVTELTNPLTGILPNVQSGNVAISAISPPTGYQPVSGLSGSANYQVTNPTAIAVDISGNVWVANTGTNTVTEIIGSATPVVAPIALGALNNKLASKP